MTGRELQQEEKNLELKKRQLTEQLVEMELKHGAMAPEDFREWWIGEGHEAAYFQLKGEVERLEDRLFMLRMLPLEEDRFTRIRAGQEETFREPEVCEGESSTDDDL